MYPNRRTEATTCGAKRRRILKIRNLFFSKTIPSLSLNFFMLMVFPIKKPSTLRDFESGFSGDFIFSLWLLCMSLMVSNETEERFDNVC